MLAERLQAEELMDDPSLDAGTYHAVLHDLAKVNRVTFAGRPTLDFLGHAGRSSSCWSWSPSARAADEEPNT